MPFRNCALVPSGRDRREIGERRAGREREPATLAAAVEAREYHQVVVDAIVELEARGDVVERRRRVVRRQRDGHHRLVERRAEGRPDNLVLVERDVHVVARLVAVVRAFALVAPVPQARDEAQLFRRFPLVLQEDRERGRFLRGRDDRYVSAVRDAAGENIAVERIGELPGVVAVDIHEIQAADEMIRPEVARQPQLLRVLLEVAALVEDHAFHR